MTTAAIISRNRLSESDIRAMLALHQTSFANVHEYKFRRDLDEKDWVICLRNDEGRLIGFSTQRLLQLEIHDCLHHFLFSGDTVVDRAHWNTPLLAGCFGHLMLRLMEDFGQEHLHWFLISKGFRTYRFLPVFFNCYWPAPGRDTPPEIAMLLNSIARHKFGDAFNPSTGIIQCADGDRLAPGLANIPPHRLHDSHIKFFLAHNPSYAQGDEMACLAPIRHDNLNGYARRVISATTPIYD
jgi:hypothetical protein